MPAKTQLYRHWGAEGELLYVGVSISAVSRLSQHKSHSHWVQQIQAVTIETFDTREEALEAERKAIIEEGPKYNIYRPKPKDYKSDECENEDDGNLNDDENANDESGEYDKRELVRRIVYYHPIYTIPEIANMLGVSPPIVRRMCENNEIGHIVWREDVRQYDSGEKVCKQYRITGWQFIEYIEAIQQKGAA